MTVTETFTCDLCGRDVDANHALFKLGFLTDAYPGATATGRFQLVATCEREACIRSPRYLGRDAFDEETWQEMMDNARHDADEAGQKVLDAFDALGFDKEDS